MTLPAPIQALLVSNDLPLGVRLGEAQKSLVVPSHFEETSKENWRYVTGTIVADGVSADTLWYADTDLGVLSSARVLVRVADDRRAAFVKDVVSLFDGRFGASKKRKPDGELWTIAAEIKSTLSLSEQIDPNGNSKALPPEKRWAHPLVVISLDVAKGQRLRVLGAGSAANVAVPAPLRELLAMFGEAPYKAPAKADHQLSLGKASAPFPRSASVQYIAKGRKLTGMTVQLEEFAKDSERLDAFEALEAELVKQLGKPKRTKKDTSMESRIEARWALETQAVELATFEFDDGNQDVPTRQVTVTFRAT